MLPGEYLLILQHNPFPLDFWSLYLTIDFFSYSYLKGLGLEFAY